MKKRSSSSSSRKVQVDPYTDAPPPLSPSQRQRQRLRSSKNKQRMTPLFSLPKWMIFTICVAPVLIFVTTMSICVSIVQKRNNTVTIDGVHMVALDRNVWKNDISAYGIDSPEHVIFATGFTVLSLVLCVFMYLRSVLLWHYSTPQQRQSRGCCCCCSLHTCTLVVGLLHAPPLILMGWTDGRNEQRVHFPAALIALETLHVYGILNFCLGVSLCRNGGLSEAQLQCLVIETVVVGCICVLFPVCIVSWVANVQAWYEWTAVFLLIVSTVPSVWHFLLLPDELCGQPKQSASLLDQEDSPMVELSSNVPFQDESTGRTS